LQAEAIELPPKTELFHGFLSPVYRFMCITMFAFVWRVVPETKGKTLEEIEEIWREKAIRSRS
jgi:SP family xylose:H+ symportor-like MFS transporter